MRYFLLVVAFVWTNLLADMATAQVPPPIDLNIQNIPQETPVWCWAAVSQQIIFASRGPAATPPQCALVGSAYNVQPPQLCCLNPMACMTTGSLQQIQYLIAAYGGHFSAITLPADPMTVYQVLAQGKPIIMAVKSSPFSGHVVVIRGMIWQQTPTGLQAILLINDPMNFFTAPVPFFSIAAYWSAAIVVS